MIVQTLSAQISAVPVRVLQFQVPYNPLNCTHLSQWTQIIHMN
jgi:hypothetical protein